MCIASWAIDLLLSVCSGSYSSVDHLRRTQMDNELDGNEAVGTDVVISMGEVRYTHQINWLILCTQLLMTIYLLEFSFPFF